MKFEKIILLALAMLPLKAVAFVAESRLTTLAGMNASMDSKRNWSSLMADKSYLFEPLSTVATIEQAYQRFLKKNALENTDDSVEAFDLLVEKMLQNGVIKVDEKSFISLIKSRY
jgi:hypothetical protein